MRHVHEVERTQIVQKARTVAQRQGIGDDEFCSLLTRYFRHMAVEDLAEPIGHLAGTGVAIWQLATTARAGPLTPGLHPRRSTSTAGHRAHRGRDRQRRHAVPGRLGHRRADPRGGSRDPPLHPATDPRSAATSTGACSRWWTSARLEALAGSRATASSSRGSTSRSTVRPTRPTSRRSWPGGWPGVLRDVREAVEDWPRMRAPGSSIGEPSWSHRRRPVGPGGRRRGGPVLALARRQQLHLHRLPRVPAGGGRPADPAGGPTGYRPGRAARPPAGQVLSSFEPADRGGPGPGPGRSGC